MSFGGQRLQTLGEAVDGLRHTVGVFRLAISFPDHSEDTLSARNILIKGDGLLLITADRQEVVDVLIVRQRSHHGYQQERQSEEQPSAKCASLLEDIEYVKEEIDHFICFSTAFCKSR